MGARDFPITDIDAFNPETESAIRQAMRAGFSPLTVEPPMTLSEFAEKHFYLSAESSQTQQRWVPYPFQPGIMDAMGDDRILEVDVFKSARVGYTKMLLASIAYDAHHKKRNQALWQPTDDDSDSFCKTELEPMLRDVKVMRKVFPSYLKKSKDNTLRLKVFLGSLLHLLGGKASKNYRRITVASAKLDEIDGFDQLIERSADPWTLSRKRLEGATFPKHIIGSTPRVKGLSHIEGRTLAAQARMVFHVPCPHCGLEHPLSWGGEDKQHGFKWDKDDPANVWHQCHHCHGKLRQSDYLRIYKDGAWVSECGNWCYGVDRCWRDAAGMPTKPPRHVAFKIWTAYSPQATWAEIVESFLHAMVKRKAGDKGPLMGWINETLGETWEDDEAEKLEIDVLKQRAEDYRLRTVPAGGLVLVAGVDVQGDRWEVVVWAMGRGEEMWVVDYCVIPGDPGLEDEWAAKLDPYLRSTFTHECGVELGISAVGIDMMGDFTHQGYNYTRFRESSKVYGVRGDPQPGQPIGAKPKLQDVNYRGTVVKRGAKLWYVGTDTAKDVMFSRLKVRAPGPGYVHFSKDLPDAFYLQLTAESRVPVSTARGVLTRWVNVNRQRNEVLDCTVYALFAAYRLALHTKTDSAWTTLQKKLHVEVPKQPRPAPAPVPEALPATPPPAMPAKRRPARPPVSPFASDDWSNRL